VAIGFILGAPMKSSECRSISCKMSFVQSKYFICYVPGSSSAKDRRKNQKSYLKSHEAKRQ
jgi:hypothetical protein